METDLAQEIFVTQWIKFRYQVMLIEVRYSQDPHMCFVSFNTAHKVFRYLCIVKTLHSVFEYTHATYILQTVRILDQCR